MPSLNSLFVPDSTLLTRLLAASLVLAVTAQTSATEQQKLNTTETTAQMALPGVTLPTPFWLASPTTLLLRHCYPEANTDTRQLNTEPMSNLLTTEQTCVKLGPDLRQSNSNDPERLPDIFAQQQAQESAQTSPVTIGGKIELDENASAVEITGGQVTIDIKTQ